jgi:hypothetical protein
LPLLLQAGDLFQFVVRNYLQVYQTQQDNSAPDQRDPEQ